MPLLEKAALEHEGKFKMIKLNIDNIPQLATALGIKSVPTVFLVHKGNIMDTFSGVPGAARLKDFVDTAVLLESMGHDEVVIQTLLDRAQEFLQKEEWEPAEKMLTEGYSYENWRDKFGAQIIVGLAAC
jgi:thioredoxin-like negative regulator of GroEL